jgi:hypothetical protein
MAAIQEDLNLRVYGENGDKLLVQVREWPHDNATLHVQRCFLTFPSHTGAH